MSSTEIVFKIIEISVQAGIGLVGLMALTSWRKQLKFKKQYDVALTLLQFLYIFEQSVKLLNMRTQKKDLLEYRGKLYSPLINIFDFENIKEDGIQLKEKIDISSKAFDDYIRSTYDAKIYWYDIINQTSTNLERHYHNLIKSLEGLEDLNRQHGISSVFNICLNIKENNLQYLIESSKDNLLKEIAMLDNALKNKINIEKDWVDFLFFRFNPLYK